MKIRLAICLGLCAGSLFALDKNLAVSGFHVGEHGFKTDEIIKEFEERGIDKMSFLTVRTYARDIPPESYYAWAKWCKEHQVYFMFLYATQFKAPGRDSQFYPELVTKMKEIAGEYFLGEQVGEEGSVMGATPRGYHTKPNHGMPQGMTDLRDCRDRFIRKLRESLDIDERNQLPFLCTLEPTGLLRYCFDAGVNLPLLEMLPGDPEFLVSLIRGCAYCYDSASWGTYIAHEWYGGFRHDDPLKLARLKAAYRYCYLAGSHIVCLESGDERIKSFGYDFPADSAVCKAYRDEAFAYERRLRESPRPAAEPEVRVAFVYGNLDAYTSFCGGTVWEQFDREAWAYGPAEWSWRILSEIRHGRDWQDMENYGDQDLSNAPGYGLYDVIPATADVKHLSKYEVVIFVGWNSMTPEIYNNLREYVAGGGRVVMTAAHLNTDTTREGGFKPIFDGDVASLAGCRIKGTRRFCEGVKFVKEGLDPTVKYPFVRDGTTDPICVGGMRNVCELEFTTGVQIACYTDDFSSPETTKGFVFPAVVENKIGKGVFTLITAAEYPGHNAIWPLYNTVVREQLTASHRRCPIKVTAPDKVRFAVYRNEAEDAVCLLNTDFTNPMIVTATGYGQRETLTLAPCEVNWIRFKRK